MCDLYLSDYYDGKWYLTNNGGNPGYSTVNSNPLSYGTDQKISDGDNKLDCSNGSCAFTSGTGAGQIFNALQIGTANQYLLQAVGSNKCLGNAGGNASLVSCTDFPNAMHAPTDSTKCSISGLSLVTQDNNNACLSTVVPNCTRDCQPNCARDCKPPCPNPDCKLDCIKDCPPNCPQSDCSSVIANDKRKTTILLGIFIPLIIMALIVIVYMFLKQKSG